MLRVAELFETIQGEGAWTGRPAVFIRLQGCDVGCPWCDTKYTWDFEGPAQDYEEAELFGHVLETLEPHPKTLLVFSGGEPCAYNLSEPTRQAQLAGYQTQIETSGTYEVRCDSGTWVTVSPKPDMPGGRLVRSDAIQRANEIKMVVGKQDDVEKAFMYWEMNQEAQVSLQPVSQSQKATELCIEACLRTGAHLSVQTHKYIGIR